MSISGMWCTGTDHTHTQGVVAVSLPIRSASKGCGYWLAVYVNPPKARTASETAYISVACVSYPCKEWENSGGDMCNNLLQIRKYSTYTTYLYDMRSCLDFVQGGKELHAMRPCPNRQAIESGS
jgi:hypothetical protein